MKKKYVLLLLTMLMALFSVLAFAACGDIELKKLDSPTDLRIASTLGKFRWSEVQNANGYQVDIDGEIYNVSTNVYDFAEITIPGIYTFRVLAKGDGEVYEDSEWATINYRVDEKATPGLHYTHILNAYTVSRGSEEISGRLVIPQDYNGYPVTQIDANAFRNCVGITEVAIPNTISIIDQSAFQGCAGLTNVQIPASVKTIGAQAFYGCESLEEIDFPNTEIEFGRNALAKTAWMESQPEGLVFVNTQIITYKGEMSENFVLDFIPDTTTAISTYAFEGMNNLGKVVLPDSIKKVGMAAFMKTGISEVTLSKKMTEIEVGVFFGCTNLKRVRIPESVKVIGQQAFSGSGLEYISFSEGLEEIGNQAFTSCEGLTLLELPSSLKTIQFGAFALCSNLEAVTFRVGINTIEELCFFNCSKLTSIIFIGTHAQWRKVICRAGWDTDAGYTEEKGEGYYTRSYTISCTDKTVEIAGGTYVEVKL